MLDRMLIAGMLSLVAGGCAEERTQQSADAVMPTKEECRRLVAAHNDAVDKDRKIANARTQRELASGEYLANAQDRHGKLEIVEHAEPPVPPDVGMKRARDRQALAECRTTGIVRDKS